MQLVINFSDIDLNDWLDDYDSELPTLKDIFKDEIVKQFVAKVNYDEKIQGYIKSQINDGLWSKIHSYKDDAAIEVITKKCIEEKLKATGSFIFLNEYARKVESVVDNYLKGYTKKIETAVHSSIRCHIESCIDELYKGSKMREFIDIEKLTSHIHTVLSKEIGGDSE